MSGRPPGKPDLSGYNYGAISSLVLTADRSALPRRDKEPDGAPTTLSGRIDPREMGSRVQRAAPKDLDKKKKKAADKQDPSERTAKRKQEAAGFGYADILEATQDVEGLTYRPRTAETRDVYELILSTVHLALVDQAQDVVRSAADTVLETLKSENMKDFDKKKEVEEVVGPVTGETFSQLINLSKKITDYGAEDETMADPDMERKDAEIDDEVGVAVVFDEEEQESDEEEGYEIRDESDDDEEGVEGDKDAEADATEGEQDGEDALVIGGASSSKAGAKAKADKDIVSPHSIDAFWVQRLVSEVYTDPQTASDKTIAVLSILGSESAFVTVKTSSWSCSTISPSMSSPSSSKIVTLSYGVPSSHVATPTNVSTSRLLCARKDWAGFCANLLGIGKPRPMRRMPWMSMTKPKLRRCPRLLPLPLALLYSPRGH